MENTDEVDCLLIIKIKVNEKSLEKVSNRNIYIYIYTVETFSRLVVCYVAKAMRKC